MSFEDFKKKALTAVGNTLDKSKDLAENTKLSMENNTLESKVVGYYKEIGKYVWENDILRDKTELVECFENIQKCIDEIESNNGKIRTNKDKTTDTVEATVVETPAEPTVETPEAPETAETSEETAE